MKNSLWRSENRTQPEPKPERKRLRDEYCKECINIDVCIGLCTLVKSINGRTETKELIPDNPVIRGIEQVDYNRILYELISDQQARDVDRIDTIRSISNYRIRAIAACALAYIPQTQIAKIAHISQGRISKLYRAVKR